MHNSKNNLNEFIQTNSPDGGFLQSAGWRQFQESAGRRTFNVASDNFQANIVEHKLPIVGRYFYIPRGPVISISNFQFIPPKRDPAKAVAISNQIPKSNDLIKKNISEVIKLAKDNNIGWIRFDPNDEKVTELIHEIIAGFKIKKSPHDMQPREIFLVDITKPEEQLLAEMKSKTRYNIKLSQKRGVSVKVISNFQFPISNQIPNHNDQISKKYVEKFIELVKITAQRDKITPHPDEYYRKMFEAIPAENIKLYIAEYDGPASTRGDASSTRGGKVVAANIVVFYGKVATYLHGASDSNYRNVMAPYLLQWQAILDAKKAGCNFYDLGGVKTHSANRKSHIANPTSKISSDDTRYEIRDTSSWAGITKFKTGFSVTTEPTIFPGSYDIVINPFRYNLYRILQRIKALF